jgi:hypothetical protein
MARTRLLATLSIVIGVLVPLIVAEMVLRFLPVRTGLQTTAVNERDPVMRMTPNREFIYSKEWNFKLVNKGRTNNIGFVNDQDYDSTAQSPLLAVIGDSQIEAQMVPFAETLQGRLARCVGHQGRVYSFAVSGVPLSQYVAEAGYARSKFRPAGVVVVIVGNDFDANFKGKAYPGMHYFQQDSNGVSLNRRDRSTSLGLRLARQSALARYIVLNLAGGVNKAQRLIRGRPAVARSYVGNTPALFTPERLEEGRRSVDAFLTTLPSYAGLKPDQILLVVDALRPELYSKAGLQGARGSFFDLMRQYVINRAEHHGFEVVDMQPRLIERHATDTTARFEYAWDNHWNGTGHEEAANAVASSKVFRRIFPAACRNNAGEGQRVSAP